MTSVVDSRAHFAKRCREIGFSERGLASLIGNGMDTLGTLAFGIGQPGVPLADDAFNNFARNQLGALASVADIATLKRLIFEAHCMVLAQLREQVSHPDVNESRKLPAVEREARMTNLKARLVGVVIDHQLEPSHSLIDIFSRQWEARQLEYVSPERCTSREWEVTRAKTSKLLAIDQDKLLVKEEKKVPEQPTQSSELQVLEALRRRGVAMACIDMISWDVHEGYLQMLFSHLRDDPPENFSRITIQQVLKADRQVFLHMIKNNVGVRRDPANLLPMDVAIIQALQSYEVGFNLMPLPKTSEPKKDPIYVPDRTPVWQQQYYQPYGKGKGHGKGKGKKGKRPVNVLPKELQNRDNVATDSHGRRLCFNYNLGKRSSKTPHGGQCDKGYHLCMRKDCHAPHPECDHGKTKNV